MGACFRAIQAGAAVAEVGDNADTLCSEVQESADVAIKSGENVLVVEIPARFQQSGFYLRFEDHAGRNAVINDQGTLKVREFSFDHK